MDNKEALVLPRIISINHVSSSGLIVPGSASRESAHKIAVFVKKPEIKPVASPQILIPNSTRIILPSR